MSDLDRNDFLNVEDRFWYADKDDCCKNCGSNNLYSQQIIQTEDYPDSWGRDYPSYYVKVCRQCGKNNG